MPVWINKRELAEHLSIKPRAINYLVKTGRLPRGVFISPRVPLWDLTVIEKALAKMQEDALAKDEPPEEEAEPPVDEPPARKEVPKPPKQQVKAPEPPERVKVNYAYVKPDEEVLADDWEEELPELSDVEKDAGL